VSIRRFGSPVRFGRLSILAQACASALAEKPADCCTSLRWATLSLVAQKPFRVNRKSLALSRLDASSLGASPKIPIVGYERIEAECPILPTWVGQDPDLSAAKHNRLLFPVGPSLANDGRKGRFAEKSQGARTKTPGLPFEFLGSFAKYTT
jgi:hypothetical protein